MQNAPRTDGPRRLSIFQLIGQHINPKYRYPANESYFTADSIQRNDCWLTDRRRQKIAEYDNATRYNDKVVRQIISLFEQKNAVLVYLSDHGEEVYDYRPKNARPSAEEGLEKEFEEYQINVPFMIWGSESYRASRAEKWAQIVAAAQRQFTTDCLPHLLFSLGEIETPIYNARHDMLSTAYEIRPIDFWKNVD